ncbi:MAG: PASTA domain-containing protein, partial [Clostridia bacterium]|nr:PASTA domain-containing protein [Clostridia bacterium]
FFCNGSLKVSGYGTPIRCHKRTGHGSITFAQTLQQSCNPSMMTLAARIGGTRFMDYFISFGYTSKTGIDLPGEAGGIYHERENFNTVELAVYSFGQTFKITPIRQLASICAVANGGYAVTPHLVSDIVNAEGQTVWSYVVGNGERVVSEEVCNTVSRILEEGVSGDGGAKNAAVPGYKIAAKTGTSQKRDIKDQNLYVGSCVAYAPADDPQISVIIVVDEPQSSIYYGSAVAAPYVAGFLEQALPYLGIQPQYTADEEAKLAVTLGDTVGLSVSEAKLALNKLGLEYEVIGEGDKVIGQMPAAGARVMKLTGRVLLYTEGSGGENAVKVPDLVGMTATDAINKLVGLGFNIELAGVSDYSRGVGATVIGQSRISEELPRGSVITLRLRYLDNKD